MSEFTIGPDDFLLDGEPFRILSGAIHYFRVHPEQWADRIEKARLLGLNTIETYVAWNAHAPRRGEFRTDGQHDLGAFLDAVADAGLHAIVRPGPYICAEWTNGGLPTWLTSTPGIRLRTSDPVYLSAVTEYLGQVLPIVAERQIDRGGPVILVQVENEYGAYGADADYLRALTAATRAAGITVPLTTVDQAAHDAMLAAGGLPELHRTASFGSRSAERLATLRAHQPSGPLMCSEFWVGWFDHWGGPHHTTDVDQSAADLDDLLAAGASVNIYMLHGGTNFGFTNGANDDEDGYRPTITSYDYDALLTEAGEPTAKYRAFREVLSRYTTVPDEEPVSTPPAPVLDVALDRRQPLRSTVDDLAAPGAWPHPPSFDDLGHTGSLAVYRTTTTRAGSLVVDGVRDVATVLLDGRPVGVAERDERLVVDVPANAAVAVLVEDLGRVNYGRRLGEAKGLTGTVSVDGEPLGPWTVLPLDLDRVRWDHLVPEPTEPGAPVLAGGTFTLEQPSDLFLDTTGWGRGTAWVNGFHLGRFWDRGPQRTLFVPGPVVRAGSNELVILDVQGRTGDRAHFVATPDLGPTAA